MWRSLEYLFLTFRIIFKIYYNYLIIAIYSPSSIGCGQIWCLCLLLETYFPCSQLLISLFCLLADHLYLMRECLHDIISLFQRLSTFLCLISHFSRCLSNTCVCYFFIRINSFQNTRLFDGT